VFWVVSGRHKLKFGVGKWMRRHISTIYIVKHSISFIIKDDIIKHVGEFTDCVDAKWPRIRFGC
jgi:hypothetical protein